MNELFLADAVAVLKKYLKRNKVKISQHLDFTDFEATAEYIRQKPVSGEFSGRKFDFHGETGFWTQGTHKGKPISIHATRYENIGERCLADHLQEQHPRVYDGSHKLGTHHCPLFYDMRGHVCYSGEFEITEEFAKNGLAGVLVAINFLLTLMRWRQVDWIWGLMHENLANSGMGARMTFTHVIPAGVNWIETPKNISSDDWLVAVDRKHLYHWARVIAERGPEPLLRTRKA